MPNPIVLCLVSLYDGKHDDFPILFRFHISVRVSFRFVSSNASLRVSFRFSFCFVSCRLMPRFRVSFLFVAFCSSAIGGARPFVANPLSPHVVMLTFFNALDTLCCLKPTRDGMQVSVHPWGVYGYGTGWFKLNDGNFIPRPKSTPFFRARP